MFEDLATMDVIELIVLVCGAVWIIANVKATTDGLARSIEHLSAGVMELREWLEKVDDKTDKTVERLSIVETKTDSIEKKLDS